MASHGRKYGEKESHPVPIWNGVFEHYERIGDALWEFEKCIDWITEERDGVGIVSGGKPVKICEIVAAIKGSNRETVRRHLDSLEKESFIRRRRTPYGHVIEVLNSRKFGIWKHPKEKPQNDVSPMTEKHGFVQEKPKSVQEKHGFVVYKEDAAVTQQEAAAAACPVWKETGVDPARLPGPFRKHCEEHWSTRNGESVFDFMGTVLDAWNAIGNTSYPPAWSRRKAELGHTAKRIRERAAEENCEASRVAIGPRRPEVQV